MKAALAAFAAALIFLAGVLIGADGGTGEWTPSAIHLGGGDRASADDDTRSVREKSDHGRPRSEVSGIPATPPVEEIGREVERDYVGDYEDDDEVDADELDEDEEDEEDRDEEDEDEEDEEDRDDEDRSGSNSGKG